MENLSDLIDGMLREPDANPIGPLSSERKKDKWPDRWNGEFWKPFIPGTRIISKEGYPGVIIDHTELLEPYLQKSFNFNLNREKDRLIYVLFDGDVLKNGCYQPYWLCFTASIRLEEK